MEIDWSLAGRTAIVTGAASGGIGATYAHCLASAGARVVCADIQGDKAAEVASAIVATGGEARSAAVDITDEEAVGALVADTVEAYGGVDVLVNNAALML